MSPEDVAERLHEWARMIVVPRKRTRRVEYVEPEGPRRTWTLWQDGRQVGMVQGRVTWTAEVHGWDETWTWRWLGAAEELAP